MLGKIDSKGVIHNIIETLDKGAQLLSGSVEHLTETFINMSNNSYKPSDIRAKPKEDMPGLDKAFDYTEYKP